MTREIPPLQPLAPIVDEMREIARDELPAPRTCRIKLWDDGTFDAGVYHSISDDELESIRYERTTSEIVWEHLSGGGYVTTTFPNGETLHEPTIDDAEVRVITTVEPPY
ncbi:hypothetical protein [Natrarchaeobius oligotrophus]|uniref:Uncharacterized protein n=1 Tax=Natrarchaeobius chitinivorans TaxID=1679083 RepID=A0A3N6PF99_NATCH|nr:hypothetical protein [Natrarchaeobius chitinivorans]RQG98679.1 hypothetical protein EA472_16960 [Natrarchaeobius chitinivorans]